MKLLKLLYCGMCRIKYKEKLLGGETIREGKICCYCLEKKHKQAEDYES